MYKTLVTVWIIVMSFFQYASAQEFYIDPVNGNDANKGTQTEPLATLQKAVLVANALTGTGSITLKLSPGLYMLTDKVSINPVRIFNSDTTRFIIEALMMPDDAGWTPDKMPVIQSVSANNSLTQFPHSTGLLVACNNVTIRGLKFIGNPNRQVFYYYPVTKENPALKGLEVSQCYFIAEKNSAPIQGAVWAHGESTNINHCIFYNCRNAILLFQQVQNFSVTHCIIYGAYESAVWMSDENRFTFKNNIITASEFVWLRPDNIDPGYAFTDCVITGNNHYTGVYTSKGPVEKPYKNFKETNIVKTGKVLLAENKTETPPVNLLHPLPGSVGYTLQAGIFKKAK